MIWLPFRKASLLIPAQTSQHSPHLYILLTDAFQYADEGKSYKANIITSISTLTKRSDKTCLLYAGDHPFIRHDSFVAYYTTRIQSTDILVEGVEKGIFIAKPPFNDDIMARIAKGLTESPQTPRYIKELFLSL